MTDKVALNSGASRRASAAIHPGCAHSEMYRVIAEYAPERYS
ncbi:hypothetical protein [Roseovarius arcticus]|nr:hypothetical protein [Roseovarius arcticus]